MIAGGESYEALTKPVLEFECPTEDCEDNLQYSPNGGLNIFKYGLLDTHFRMRGRQGRAIKLANLTQI